MQLCVTTIISFKFNNIIVTQYNAHNTFHIAQPFDVIKYYHATTTFYNNTACIFSYLIININEEEQLI